MEKPLKKVLIIAYYWPPSAGSGVQRWLKFVKYLRLYGWEPIVYTPLNPDFDLKDEKLQEEIPEGIAILKQPIFEPFQIYNQLMGQKAEKQVNPVMKGKAKLGLKAKTMLWIRANIFIPDSRMFWIKPSVKFLIVWLKENKVDAMVTTGPPHSMHVIGLKIKRKTNIPWLADFRDPWTRIDFYHELNLEPWADRKHKNLENAVINEADHVVVVGNNMKEEYQPLTSRPVSVVTNGYDPADIDVKPEAPLDKAFSIIHIGMLGKARSHPIFWKGLYELRKENPDLKEKLEVRIYGVSDPIVQEQIKDFEDTSWIQFLPYVPHHEVIQIQRKARVLLLSVNDVPMAKGIITGKIFEYLAIGRPILCIGPPDGDAASIVNEAQAGPVVDFSDLEGFKKAVLKLFSDFQQEKDQLKPEGIEKYSRKALCQKIGDILNSMASSSLN
jgi:glycosyltransferase involved in cell wall biosynthesis